MRSLFVILVILCLAFVKSKNIPQRPILHERIIGGEEVDIEDCPYVVSVRNRDQHICGGSIINERYVLTAAHCTYEIEARTLSIRAGSSEHNTGGVVIGVEQKIEHNKYNANKIRPNFDFSMLRLSRKIIFDSSKQPVNLPPQSSNVSEGIILHVSGWGYLALNSFISLKLQGVSVPKVNDKKCDESYSLYGGITGQMMCAGFLGEGGKDSCQGDSGGPLVDKNNTLVGVVSWGIGCAEPHYPGVYAKVSEVVDWIKSVMSSF